MKHIELVMPLLVPDIMEYITGREVVCKLVLGHCKMQANNVDEAVTVKSRIFTDLDFSQGDIIKVLLSTGKELKIKISYGVLLLFNEELTVEELATQLWKYMCRVVRNN